MRSLWIVVAVIAVLILWDVAWWDGFGVSPLSPWTLKMVVNQDNAPTIIDVRSPQKFNQFNIPGAVNVPYPATLAQLVHVAPAPTNPVVVVSMTGHRSSPVARQLLNGGYTDVTNVTWGMLAWKLFGGETVSGK